jgi:hypothetical protein
MPAREAEAVARALERGEVLLQRDASRVASCASSRSPWSSRLFLHVGAGLVDRRHDCAGRGVGLLAGVDRAGSEATLLLLAQGSAPALLLGWLSFWAGRDHPLRAGRRTLSAPGRFSESDSWLRRRPGCLQSASRVPLGSRSRDLPLPKLRGKHRYKHRELQGEFPRGAEPDFPIASRPVSSLSHHSLLSGFT